MDESLFLRVLLKEKIKVTPVELSAGVREHIVERLVKKCEGKCTRHGFIRSGSIEVLKISLGRVDMATLNGDVTYTVQFAADICNPVIGSVLKARVVNSNRFGLLAEAGVRDSASGTYTPVLDIIIAKQTVSMKSEVDLEGVQINDEVLIEVMGKKFDLDDPKLSIVGRVLRMNALDAVLPTASVGGDMASVADVDDEGSDDLADIDDGLLSDKDDDEEEEYDDGIADPELDGDDEVVQAAAVEVPARSGPAVDGSEHGEEGSDSGFASEEEGDDEFFDGDGINDDEF